MYMKWVIKLHRLIDNELSKPFLGFRLYHKETNHEIHKWEITGWQFFYLITPSWILFCIWFTNKIK